MKNSTLTKLLSVLSENEIRLISRKLKVLEQNELLLKLFNYLKNNINKPNKLQKEKVSKAIYTNTKSYSNQKFKRLRFQLFHLIENEILFNFLTAEDDDTAKFAIYLKAKTLYNFYETKNYIKNNVNNDALAILKQRKLLEMKDLIENFHEMSESFFLNKYIIATELYYNFQNQDQNYIDASVKNLDTFFCLAKMKIGAEIGQRNLWKNKPVENKTFEEIINFSQNLKINDIPMLQIYKVIGKLYQKVEFKNLKLLKELVFRNADLIHKKNLAIVIGILNNFTISGQIEQTNEVLKLKYQIMKFGFELKKIRALKKTLNIHCLLLEKKFYYKIQKLCESYIYILEKKFMLAYNILDNNSFLPYNMLAKALRLRCVYELEMSKVSYFDGSLFDEALVFKRYANRQFKKSAISRSSYNSFMNLVNFLLDLTNPVYTKEELLEMLNNKYTEIRYKNWCLEKVNNLT